MSERYVTAITGSETAVEILESLIEMRKHEGTSTKKGSYQIREFPENQSLDTAGRPVECCSSILNGRDIDLAVADEGTFINLANKLEREIGVPNLPKYNAKNLSEGKMVSLADIKSRLDKMRRRAEKHKKDLRAIGAEVTDVPSPQVEGAIEALDWLYNNGDGRKYHDIAYYLYRKLVARERDRLFYIRRHPKQQSLHICHNEELNEEISTLIWALNGNPFVKVAMKGDGYCGQARF